MPFVAVLLLGFAPMPQFGSPKIAPFFSGKRAAFSLEFDDSMDSQVKNVFPLLKQFGFSATFYINPGRTNYRSAIWEKEVVAAGHELADHTVHHRDTVGAEEASAEIGGAAKTIEKAYGHKRLTVFGTPGGVKWEIPPADFARILKENRLIFPGRDDFYQDGQGDITRFPRLALDKGVWRKLGFHGVGGEWLSTSVENLTALLQFLDVHRDELWIAPTGTVWKYQREREAAQDVVLHAKDDRSFTITWRFDRSKLDPFELYDVPLTIEVSVPESWKAAKVSADGRTKTLTVSEGLLRFEALPQTKTIKVVRA